MSFITEVICKFIFTDVHMRNNYRPNRAYVSLALSCPALMSPLKTVYLSLPPRLRVPCFSLLCAL